MHATYKVICGQYCGATSFSHNIMTADTLTLLILVQQTHMLDVCENSPTGFCKSITHSIWN